MGATGPAPYPEFDGSQLCAQTDPALFIPDHAGASPRVARRLCRGCSFIDECREWAVWQDVEGVWGGSTAYERQRERRRRGIKLIDPDAPGGLRERILAANREIPAAVLARELGCSEKSVQRHRKAA